MQPRQRLAGLSPCAIIAMGVSGCGKSTLMKDLAGHLGAPAFEGDEYHSAASIAKMRAGTPLDDDDRWPWLDRLGAAIGEAVRGQGIAVASCSALKRSYRERLERAAGVPMFFALLDGERDKIAPRLAARADHYVAPGLIDSQFATLEHPGVDERALVLHCYQPIEQLRDQTLNWVKAQIVP